MKRRSIKKIIFPNLPYLFIALFATKLPQAWRLAEGADASEKLLHLLDSLTGAFRSPFPSFHPLDLCVGILIAAAIRLAVYLKAKNAKKYRKNVEYGSARWGNARRHCAIHGRGPAQEYHPDPDRGADDVKSSEESKGCPQQKCAGGRRLRFR